MTCSACHSPVPPDARFCPGCGTAVAAPGRPRELRKTITVLFCDMADSTALSGRLDAESLREVMIRYYELMRECLERYGGTVEKFIGDAVVAVFGVPVLHEDDARRALAAASEMLRAIESLNEEIAMLIGVEIAVRIGVNTGEVVAATDAVSGQVIASGEAMNIAARLQQHAQPGQVILGPATRMLTDRDAVFDPVGDLALKGVSQLVSAWRLVRLLPDGAGRLPDRGRPFIGRQVELGVLAARLNEAVQAQSCVTVNLYGDPGAGKTRLAAEFIAQAASLGALAGAGRCQPYGEGPPLAALGEVLRQIMAGARRCGLLNAGSGPDFGPDFGEALAHLERGLLHDDSPGEVPGQLSWAVTEVLQAIGRYRPVLLILDDLHAAKPVLRHVLGEIADRAGGVALIICLGRSEIGDMPPSWRIGGPGAGVLSLGPLGPDDALRLFTALSAETPATTADSGPDRDDPDRDDPYRDEVTPHQGRPGREIVERAGGNPFFLEQLVGVADHRGTDALPPTVRSVIAARLDLLRPAEQDVLLRASVPGVRFSLPELTSLLAAEPPAARPPGQSLGELARRRLIMADGTPDAYRFCGILIRDVAYHTLPKRARLDYHEQLAAWHGQVDGSADQVGLHLRHAHRLAAELYPAGERVRRLRDDAARALAQAGEAALRRGDLYWAEDLLSQAVRLRDDGSAEWIAASVHLAEARLLLGTGPDPRRRLRSLAAQAEAAGERLAAAHASLLLAALEVPGPSAAEDTLEMVPLFDQAGDELGLARAWLRVAQLSQLRGRYGDAEGPLHRALAHALRSGAELELATVIGGLATSLWRGPAEVAAGVRGCRDLLARHGAGRRTVRATVNCPYAILLAYQGEHDAARVLTDSSARIMSELGHAYGAVAVPIFEASLAGLAGHWAEAEELLTGALPESQRNGDGLMVAAAVCGLARARLEQGRADEAGELLGTVSVTGDPFTDAEAFGVSARVFAARGDADQAIRLAQRSCDIAAKTDAPACRATAALDQALALRELGMADDAAASAREAARLFHAKGHLVGMARAAAAETSRPRPSRGSTRGGESHE